MAQESIEHLIQRKLEPTLGVAGATDRDAEPLMTRWWNALPFTSNDRRKAGKRTYWVGLP